MLTLKIPGTKEMSWARRCEERNVKVMRPEPKLAKINQEIWTQDQIHVKTALVYHKNFHWDSVHRISIPAEFETKLLTALLRGYFASVFYPGSQTQDVSYIGDLDSLFQQGAKYLDYTITRSCQFLFCQGCIFKPNFI